MGFQYCGPFLSGIPYHLLKGDDMKKILLALLLMLLCIPSTIGCLVFGGKTYTTGPSPEMENRIAQLEQRIRYLEQINGITAQPSGYQSFQLHSGPAPEPSVPLTYTGDNVPQD